ncbi:5-methyltetrahydropteroyltriglutamate--homocysteine S-methyltransferase [Gimesia maris]|uniref:5-methyltetrahydropteroyltriglutamate--homocysteine methyltransferase n=1 Tax=Gimesia maris TaxID=122 RepID=A0ABX5YH60_9PLAN|nr:5-methyltetrahydropteroyltriglutamate--homocysteine S-methyltransferase [Gimesia maris]EDL61598.1 5-methyltetrahydropteroyltriglutamate--homocysteine methyltransferase [Gimesia maris DSM 8797]QEG15005.1 5-methyltetrahydropteroyltriglutamate--homocysteine methyltransferase [Gimesia maris]QGQ31629.1 5-methyltetrahydropteroyltriglutamate--homocysteine S-methyltransferase [Gimesia maris]
MAIATNLGFPRIGAHRELKRAVEKFWSEKISEAELQQIGRGLRETNWKLQQAAGIEQIPSNDFSFYDQVLDTTALVGAIPARFQWTSDAVDLTTYFAMARGGKGGKSVNATTAGVAALEMTKWFDTNYHYLVPEFKPDQQFQLASTKVIDEFLEAKALGIETRPVLLGPVSFLLLGKSGTADFDCLSLLERLLPVYAEVLTRLSASGATWIQIDEPCLVLDLTAEQRVAFQRAYDQLSIIPGGIKIALTTYFGPLAENLPTAVSLPIAALHVDLVRAPEQLDDVLEQLPAEVALSLGVIDGRNIWKNDFEQSLALIEKAVNRIGADRILIGPSCSLLHSPVDLENETDLDSEIRQWLAYARQKLAEISILTQCVNAGRESVADALSANRAAMNARRNSPRVHRPEVKERSAAVTEPMLTRKSPYAERRVWQQKTLQLPLFPTTTIGSFPQTEEIRKARAAFKKGELTESAYEQFLQACIASDIEYQESVDLDVLVHGEAERNDMVEYFGEQLEGFIATKNGWVQSYGSRCVKPPIIFGDILRKGPMTVKWTKYAQSCTGKLMKGMLTGPVTILQWSFVRDDQPRSETCQQIGLAIRDEVLDLEAGGIRIIQIDEPAVREGLPLRRSDWHAYLKWAVDCFRLSAAGVEDETQIHTHMCYSEFNDIIEAIAALDADVISIETSRSNMELLDAFVQFHYPNEIGPGVYDIHSPQVPTVEWMVDLLEKALKVLEPRQLWVNPDCGLKTRKWDEVRPALQNMVTAAKTLRAKLNLKE